MSTLALAVVPLLAALEAAKPYGVSMTVLAVTSVACAAVLCSGEWLIVRRHGIQLGWWLLASAPGATVILATILVYATLMYRGPPGMEDWRETWGGTLNGALAAAPLLVAAGQWIVLRRYVSRARWWVLSGAVGGFAGYTLFAVWAMDLLGFGPRL